MKKIALVIIVFTLLSGCTEKPKTSSEMAGETVQTAVGKLVVPAVSEGRRIHFLDYDKLLNTESRQIIDFEATTENNYYLFYIDDGSPRTAFIVEEKPDGKVSMLEPFGDPAGYLHARKTAEGFSPDREPTLYYIGGLEESGHHDVAFFIKLFVLKFEKDGTEYYIPFKDDGNGIDPEFLNVKDFRVLPTTEDLLSAAGKVAAEIRETRRTVEETGQQLYGTPVIELHVKH